MYLDGSLFDWLAASAFHSLSLGEGEKRERLMLRSGDRCLYGAVL